MKAQRHSLSVPAPTAHWRIEYFVALLAAVGLALLARGCGVDGESSCPDVGVLAEMCYGANTVMTACQVEDDYGMCFRPGYWECYNEHECSGIDDTDTITKLESCLAANEACE